MENRVHLLTMIPVNTQVNNTGLIIPNAEEREIVVGAGVEIQPIPKIELLFKPRTDDHPVMDFISPPGTLDVGELMRKAYDYFLKEDPTVVTEEITEEDSFTGDLKTRVVKKESVPQAKSITWAGFLSAVHLTESEFLTIANKIPQVRRMMEVCSSAIKHNIIKGGLLKQFDGRFAQFVAMNETDMKNGGNENSNAVGQVSEVLKAIEEAAERGREKKYPDAIEVKQEVKPSKKKVPLSGIDDKDIL